MSFQGAGGPPVRTKSEGRSTGGGGAWPEFGFSETIGGKQRRLPSFSIKASEPGRRLLILDHYGDQHRFAALIHTFKGRDGKWYNMLASPHRTDPLGDPMNEALLDDNGNPKEPSWAWVLTAIDIDGRPPTKPNGKVYKNQRTLVLVSEKQASTFSSMERIGKGFRGRIFKVTRSDAQMSFRIGDSWEPLDQLSEDEMRVQFAGAAQEAGVPIDDFLKPVDYKTVLAPLPREKLLEIANDLKRIRAARDNVSVPQGDSDDLPF